jgi:hypothetical protein
MGKDADVLRLADDAIKNYREDARLYAARGLAKYKTAAGDEDTDSDDVFFTRLDSAVLDLDKAISLDPKQALFRFWRAELHHFRGNADKKASDIAAGKKLDPGLNWEYLETPQRSMDFAAEVDFGDYDNEDD